MDLKGMKRFKNKGQASVADPVANDIDFNSLDKNEAKKVFRKFTN